MNPNMIHREDLERFSHVFIGGTPNRTWRDIEIWVEFARDKDCQIHIGRCGQVDDLYKAEKLGVDSVDSSTIARNGYWDRIVRFRREYPQELFVV
jgi:queuine/archaeosine tRNA-ribosyltransferase